tara:strand:+ start:2116 stop:2328 length:213 start_codon:yes stop_codon:yes gene_type:complete
MKLFFFIFLSFIFSFNSAYAYLDPGTGSMILQAILAVLAAGITALSVFWSKVKIFILEISKKLKDKKTNK